MVKTTNIQQTENLKFTSVSETKTFCASPIEASQNNSLHCTEHLADISAVTTSSCNLAGGNTAVNMSVKKMPEHQGLPDESTSPASDAPAMYAANMPKNSALNASVSPFYPSGMQAEANPAYTPYSRQQQYYNDAGYPSETYYSPDSGVSETNTSIPPPGVGYPMRYSIAPDAQYYIPPQIPIPTQHMQPSAIYPGMYGYHHPMSPMAAHSEYYPVEGGAGLVRGEDDDVMPGRRASLTAASPTAAAGGDFCPPTSSHEAHYPPHNHHHHHQKQQLLLLQAPPPPPAAAASHISATTTKHRLSSSSNTISPMVHVEHCQVNFNVHPPHTQHASYNAGIAQPVSPAASHQNGVFQQPLAGPAPANLLPVNVLHQAPHHLVQQLPQIAAVQHHLTYMNSGNLIEQQQHNFYRQPSKPYRAEDFTSRDRGGGTYRGGSGRGRGVPRGGGGGRRPRRSDDRNSFCSDRNSFSSDRNGYGTDMAENNGAGNEQVEARSIPAPLPPGYHYLPQQSFIPISKKLEGTPLFMYFQQPSDVAYSYSPGPMYNNPVSEATPQVTNTPPNMTSQLCTTQASQYDQAKDKSSYSNGIMFDQNTDTAPTEGNLVHPTNVANPSISENPPMLSHAENGLIKTIQTEAVVSNPEIVGSTEVLSREHSPIEDKFTELSLEKSANVVSSDSFKKSSTPCTGSSVQSRHASAEAPAKCVMLECERIHSNKIIPILEIKSEHELDLSFSMEFGDICPKELYNDVNKRKAANALKQLNQMPKSTNLKKDSIPSKYKILPVFDTSFPSVESAFSPQISTKTPFLFIDSCNNSDVPCQTNLQRPSVTTQETKTGSTKELESQISKSINFFQNATSQVSNNEYAPVFNKVNKNMNNITTALHQIPAVASDKPSLPVQAHKKISPVSVCEASTACQAPPATREPPPLASREATSTATREPPPRATREPPPQATREPPSQATLEPPSQAARKPPPPARRAPPPARDAPPLAREAPPLAREAPPLAREAPPLAREAPPLAREAPPLAREAPPPAREAPTPAREAPPLAREAHPPAREAPPPACEAHPPAREAPAIIIEVRPTPGMASISVKEAPSSDSPATIRDSPSAVHEASLNIRGARSQSREETISAQRPPASCEAPQPVYAASKPEVSAPKEVQPSKSQQLGKEVQVAAAAAAAAQQASASAWGKPKNWLKEFKKTDTVMKPVKQVAVVSPLPCNGMPAGVEASTVAAPVNGFPAGAESSSSGAVTVTTPPTVNQRQFVTEKTKIGGFLLDYSTNSNSVILQPRGLTNKNYWCYSNTVLQAMVCIPQFVNLYLKMDQQLGDLVTPYILPVTYSIISFLKQLSSMNSTSINLNSRSRGKKSGNNIVVLPEVQYDDPFEPSSIHKMLLDKTGGQFMEGYQQDAEEMLTFLLNASHDEFNECLKLASNSKVSKNAKISTGQAVLPNGQADDGDDWVTMGPKNKSCVTRTTLFSHSPISKIFWGESRSLVKKGSAPATANLEPFITLPLDIQDDKITSVKDALDQFVSKADVDGYTCAETREEVQVSNQRMLEQLPEVLILQLKRFVYSKDGGLQKLVKDITFPIDLEITRDLISTNSRKKLIPDKNKYRLVSIIYHDGKEASKGHYVCDVFHAGYNCWLHYDDACVKPIHATELLRCNAPRVPYILFYRREDTFTDGVFPVTPMAASLKKKGKGRNTSSDKSGSGERKPRVDPQNSTTDTTANRKPSPVPKVSLDGKTDNESKPTNSQNAQKTVSNKRQDSNERKTGQNNAQNNQKNVTNRRLDNKRGQGKKNK